MCVLLEILKKMFTLLEYYKSSQIDSTQARWRSLGVVDGASTSDIIAMF